MFIAFPVLLLIAVALVIPAWVFARNRGRDSHWSLFMLWLPAVVLWVVLSGLGIGAQSLSNLIEPIWLIIAGIALAYLKVFILDRYAPSPQAVTVLSIVVLALVAVLLRIFMPVLPE